MTNTAGNGLQQYLTCPAGLPYTTSSSCLFPLLPASPLRKVSSLSHIGNSVLVPSLPPLLTCISNDIGYDQKDDVARVDVPSATAGPRERLTFLFSDTTDEATRLDLEWESLRVSVPIKVDTKAQVRAGIDKSLGDAWRPHFAAGRYLYDSGGDLDTALQYLDTSIGIKPTWWNNWIRAQVLAKKGRPADAIAAAQKALELGKGDDTFQNSFKADVEKAVADWKKAKS